MMAEHSFQEVMGQWHRMCDSFGVSCTGCELYGNGVFCGRIIDKALSKRFEEIIMQWAAENPYPDSQTWISVNKRMPSIGETVVFFGIDGVMVGYFAGNNTRHNAWKSTLGYVFWDEEITHWMHLPEPPKEDAN